MGRGLFLSSIGLIGSDDRVIEAIIHAGYFLAFSNYKGLKSEVKGKQVPFN